MNRHGLYVPLPYPDESLYSVIARFVRHLGLRSPKMALELLFDMRTVVASTDLQGRLGRLRWLFEDRWGWALHQAAWNLTLLPYYTAYRSGVERERAVAALIGDRAGGLHNRLGICASGVPVPPRLRQCPRCVAVDLAQRGETYWRRAHQLPGVWVCPEHGVPLVASDVPTRGRARHAFVAAPHTLALVGPEVALTHDDLALAWDIARRSQALLAVPYHGPETGKHREQVERLTRLGYDARRGALPRLERDLVQYVGPTLLSALDPSWARTGTLPWLRAIRRQPRRTLHPLRHVLLDAFIDHQQRYQGEAPSPGFGPGPWTCLNWLAPHYRQAVVYDMRPLAPQGGHPTARFACSCGLVFSRRPDDTERPRHVIRFGPLFELEARRLRDGGRTVRGVAWALDVDPKTAKRLLGPSAETSANAQRQRAARVEADQTAWEQLIAAHPGVGVTALRAREPALFSRLYRACPDWLGVHAPAAVPTPSHPARVDWAARDRALAEKVDRAAAQLLAEDPPRRVTRDRLAARLGCRSLIQKKLHLLPGTAARLEALCESPEQFRLRRVRAAAARLGPSAPRWRVLQVAGVRSEHVTARLLAAADAGRRDGRGGAS